MRELLKNGSRLLFKRQTNILSAAMVIMVTYGLSHLIGLFKTRLLISYFFSSKAQLLDVYYAAFVIPDTLFQLLIIGSLSAAFIPVFTRYLSKDKAQAWHIASASLNLILLAFLTLSLVIFIFAVPLARLIGPGFQPEQITLMAQLLRVMLTAQAFFAVSSFLTAVIQSHQRFLIPALAPVAYNLGIISGTIFLSPSMGIFGPAVGVVIGAFMHMLMQIPLALRLGFRFRLLLDTRHPGVRETIRLIPPRALGLGIDQIEQFVAVILASLMVSGSLTLFNVARLLYSIPSTLFGVTLGQASLPTLSRQSASHPKSFYPTFTDTLLQAIFLALPLSIFFIVLRIPIIRIVFGSRSFPWFATLTTGKTLAVLAASSVFATSLQLIVRAFYALHDTRTPLYVGFFAAIFDVLVGIIATQVFNFGVLGIALAISLTAFFESLALYFLLVRRLKPEAHLVQHFLWSVAKIFTTAIITGVSLWIPMRLLDQFVFDTTRTLPLIGLTLTTSVIGAIVYLVLSYLFRVRQLTNLIVLFRLKNIYSPSPPTEPLILPASDQN